MCQSTSTSNPNEWGTATGDLDFDIEDGYYDDFVASDSESDGDSDDERELVELDITIDEDGVLIARNGVDVAGWDDSDDEWSYEHDDSDEEERTRREYLWECGSDGERWDGDSD